MKSTFDTTVFLDKLRRRLVNTSVTSPLILPAILVALITTPMAACTNSNVKDSSGQVHTVSVTPTPSNGSSNPATDPWTSIQSIHMLDKTHGWALASTSEHLYNPQDSSSVLKTSDGGMHWQDVTPPNGKISNAFFLNNQDAWGISFAIQPNSTPAIAESGLPADNRVNVLCTTDGGQSWQSSSIESGTVSGAYPFFLNASEGWLQVFGTPGMGGQVPSTFFHTTDGGLHWEALGNTSTDADQLAIIRSSGISFSDPQNGWEAGLPRAGGAQPMVDVTHDGGRTWHSLSLPTPPEADPDSQVQTVTPPVFFGKDGILPIEGAGIDLYVTHDAGQTWTPTKTLTSNGQGSLVIDILDMQHVWVAVGTDFSTTSNGGQSWTKLPRAAWPMSTLDFVDANNGWAIETTPGNGNTQQTQLLHTTNGGRTWPTHSMSQLTTPLASIRMLDNTHGWALTETSVLKTSDGGNHWNNVTPANASLDLSSKGDFLNAQDAWVATPQGQNSISILRTTNGGKNWQNSTIQTTATEPTDMPHFLNPSNGWLLTNIDNSPSAIFHTTDGGQHWNQLGNLNQKDLIHPSGISFSDAQNGWETGDGGGGDSTHLLIGATHDGGQTWHNQTLPVLPGASPGELVETEPPVLSGKDGLLPVEDSEFTPSSITSGGNGLDLYVTHDGGQTWTPTKVAIITSNWESLLTVYAIDTQHVWAVGDTNLSVTSDGGQSWTKLPPTPQSINALSFIGANNGWAITPTELLRTTNGGRSWQQTSYSIQ